MDELIKEGFEQMGISLPESALWRFKAYYEYLEEQNRVMNLTAISGAADVAALHFIDSVAPLKYFYFENARIIDIGSGAGFPGLPLKIACPTIDLTLMDAQKKRVDFLSRTCGLLELNDVRCVCLRAEEAKNEYRESFDFALSRAVARLNLLCELCLPFIKVSGSFLAMKGTEHETELQEAAHAIDILGGKLKAVHKYSLPGTAARHCIIEIEKISPSPKDYPRRFAKMSKSPL